MVLVTTLPQAKEGQLTVEPLTTPAITFCPYNDSRLVTRNPPVPLLYPLRPSQSPKQPKTGHIIGKSVENTVE